MPPVIYEMRQRLQDLQKIQSNSVEICQGSFCSKYATCLFKSLSDNYLWHEQKDFLLIPFSKQSANIDSLCVQQFVDSALIWKIHNPPTSPDALNMSHMWPKSLISYLEDSKPAKFSKCLEPESDEGPTLLLTHFSAHICTWSLTYKSICRSLNFFIELSFLKKYN